MATGVSHRCTHIILRAMQISAAPQTGLLAYNLIPGLHRFTLTFFFAGLCISIQLAPSSIATAVIVMIVLWVAFILITTLILIKSPSRPYKTSLHNALLMLSREASITNSLLQKARHWGYTSNRPIDQSLHRGTWRGSPLCEQDTRRP